MTVHFSPYLEKIDNKTLPREVARQSRPGFYRKRAKRIGDIVLTLLMVPFAVPIIALMALLVLLDGHNPFYSQLRLGYKGQTFRMWKLRSMVYNADDLLEAYLAENPAARTEWDTTQKLKRDPRITFVGRVLRKTSMDELPQLLNVLNGTMSLVGPRPMMVCQQESYPGTAYYNLRPGVTGMWQVSDRNQSEFTARADFDDLYEREVSLKTDIQILLRTIKVVLRGTGY